MRINPCVRGQKRGEREDAQSLKGHMAEVVEDGICIGKPMLSTTTMASRSSLLADLTVTPPTIDKEKEELQANFNKSALKLIDTAKCVPDNKEELEEEKQMWMKQWNGLMNHFVDVTGHAKSLGMKLQLSAEAGAAITTANEVFDLWAATELAQQEAAWVADTTLEFGTHPQLTSIAAMTTISDDTRRRWPNKHLKANAPACTTGHCGLDSAIMMTQCSHTSDDATQPRNAPHGRYGLNSAIVTTQRSQPSDDATQPRNAPARHNDDDSLTCIQHARHSPNVPQHVQQQAAV
ncbi:hypothetical protein BU15DRAFT_59965 [Melanogaster broomeanus]|nr:hypothetical protein BU15DRAFT_59965 [Melanogaster broomeanus]